MRGRLWLIVGIAAGVAIGIGKLPFFAGAASSFADTALRTVGSAGAALVRAAATHGASTRVVDGITAVVAVLVPGVTATLLVFAARTTLRLRALVALAVAALGVASFFYLPHGTAVGVVALAFIAAGIAVVATGPLVAAPLAGLAALIGTAYLPRILASKSTLPDLPVSMLHTAIYGVAGSPYWLCVVVLAIAALPFGYAARLALR